jgi:predicted transcriptional regulator
MSPDTLAAAAAAIYGDYWQSALARDLGVADRTVRRWLAGDSPIPEGVAGELAERLRARVQELVEIMGRLDRERAAPGGAE